MRGRNAIVAGAGIGWMVMGHTGQQPATSFVDAHVHANVPDSAAAYLTRNGLAGAVVFIGAQASNDDILRLAMEPGGRLIPFASVSPERREFRAAWQRGDTSIVRELDEMLGRGRFQGIGELSIVHFSSDGPTGTAGEGRRGRIMRGASSAAPPSRGGGPPTAGGFPQNDFDPSGPIMRGIMRVAERRRLPVMIHCEVTRLRELETLLDAFPNVPVIWAHGGYTQLVLASRMLDRHPNLIYELSARTWSRHPRSPDYTVFRNDSLVWPEWISLIERNSHRVIVGTDATLRSLDDDQRKVDRVRLLLSQLSDSTRGRVASENLLRLTRAAR